MDKIVEILSPWIIKHRNQAINAYIGHNVSKVETPEEIAAEIRAELKPKSIEELLPVDEKFDDEVGKAVMSVMGEVKPLEPPKE